ncbi:hypothetical protein XAC3810_530086 [Xanthomonas citri pv. citri]|uniref:Uncharacterized protein n=1 Tax=Xanthomonas citri pv. citri TaxID=611301 RepID=A0A0U5BW56_XANCI|nr:hypothetical protein XAC9322_530086 [Xanthomonas citri pv. citri]CEJ46081.1 hypothetical protein XAB3213_3310036 [Xanthomonas citri pv. bilvae]CEE31975.1 hypothetical protein XAC3824_670086 [Xanthomonas citri pv. citri]CEE33446.1 hypothetical protein XAC1083_530061 [Xanthomonas citri pv. citri]CEE42767.1 hypothetical protein XAC3810_530086 [Xanthomonas citri pv. citri]
MAFAAPCTAPCVVVQGAPWALNQGLSLKTHRFPRIQTASQSRADQTRDPSLPSSFKELS